MVIMFAFPLTFYNFIIIFLMDEDTKAWEM